MPAEGADADRGRGSCDGASSRERRRRPRRAQGVRRRRGARRRGPARGARASWSRSSGRAGAGSRRCWSSCAGSRSPTPGTVSAPPAALMPQRDALLPWLSALDNAALARRVAGDSRARRARGGARALRGASGWRASSARGRPRCRGGMRQRVAFLRTLLAGRPLLCLDEPFAALDALTRAQAQTWLAEALAREPRTVLLVTHDVEEAVLLADRVVLLSPRPGRVVPELDVAARAPARADGPRVVVELRERALAALGVRGVIAPLLRASSCSLLAGLGARRAGRAWSTSCCCPRRRRSPQSLWEDRVAARPGPAGDHLRGRARARRGARARRRARRGDAPRARGRSRAAAARGRLAGRADPGDRAADRADPRVRAGAEDPDHRADLLLPDRRSTSPTGCATPTPTRASCCARWTRRAGSGCASSRRRRRCRPAFTGMKIAAAVAVIGAVLAEWAGSDAGLGHLLITANGQLETRARVRRDRVADGRGGRALRALRARSSGGSSPGRRGTVMKRFVVIAALLAAARRLRREGRADRRRARAPGAVHGHARLLPQRRPRGHLRRRGRGPLRAGRASTSRSSRRRTRPRR